MHSSRAPRSDQETLSTILQAAGISHELIHVGAYARTAQEAADNLGAPLSAIVKSLVCVADDSPLVALVPGHKDLSFVRLSEVVGASVVRLASRAVVRSASGYAVGTVAPAGLPLGLAVYGDSSIRDLDTVFCGAGSDRHMLRIAPRDLDLLTPIVWTHLCD